MATHTPLEDVFHTGHWHQLRHLTPKEFRRALPDYLAKSERKLVHLHFNNQAHFHHWVAGCYKQLFKLLSDLAVTDVIVEPRIKKLLNPPFAPIYFGCPDLLVYSQVANGMVGLEIKTSVVQRPPEPYKIKMYQLGLNRFIQQRGMPPLRSVEWVNFTPSGHDRGRSLMKRHTFPVDAPSLHEWFLENHPSMQGMLERLYS
ncbi:MAG: hypothetical protein WAX89_07105 [Alphaproteobacteria bacterium]